MPPRSKKKTPTPVVSEEKKVDPVETENTGTELDEAVITASSIPSQVEDNPQLVDDTPDPVDPDLQDKSDPSDEKELDDLKPKLDTEELNPELKDKSEVLPVIDGSDKSEELVDEFKTDYAYPIIVNLNSLLHSMKKYSLEELGKRFEIIYAYRNKTMTGPNDSELAFTTEANYLELKSGYINFIRTRSSHDEFTMIKDFLNTKFKRFDKVEDGKFIYY
jgi:hypothetical protein